jgi:TP901 family phage tail tape measure protein
MASVEELILRISQQGGRNTEQQLRSIRDVIRDYARQASNSATKSLALGQGLQQVSQSLGNVGRNLTNYVTKNLVKVATGSIATAATFEQGMSRVRAVTGATGKDFTTLKNLALEMGSKTTKTATESAQAIEYMGLAGWTTRQIQEGLEPVLRASEAGMMDLGLTSDLVTDSMSALGIETKDLNRYLDIGAKAQNSSNQSMQQFLEAMVTAGGSFKMFNVPLEEAGGLLSVLANRGYKGSEAGNALISIMNNLTTGTGRAGEAMGELGIEIYDGNGKFRGMTKILGEMNQKFDGMTDAQRNTYIQMIGGKTRTKELNALLNGQSKELSDVTKKLYDSEGALSGMAKTMQDNLLGQWTKFKSAIEGIAISIGTAFLPYLKQGLSWLMKLAEGFNGMGNGGKIMVGIIAAIAAAIGPLLLVFAGLGSLVSNIIILWAALAPVISAIGAPVIAVVGALALLIPALAALLLSSKDVRNGIGNVFNSIKEKVGGAISFIKTHIDDIKTVFQGFFNFLTSGNFDSSFESMKNALKNMFPNHAKTIDDIILKFVTFRQKVINIRDALIKFGSKVMNILGTVKDSIGKSLSKFDFSAIVSAFSNLKTAVQPLMPILKLLGTILITVITVAVGIAIGGLNGFIAAIDNIVAMIANVFGIIQSIIGIAIGLIIGLFTGNWTMLQDSAKALWENVKGFFVNGITAIIDFVSSFVTSIIDFFKSVYMAVVGGSIIPDLINGVINWFKKLISKPVSYVKFLYDKAKAIFNAIRSAVTSVVKSLISKVVNYFVNLYSKAKARFNAIKSAASSIWNAIKSKISSVASSIYSKVSSIFSKVVSIIRSKLNSARSAVGKAMSGIVSKVRGIGSKLYSAGKNAIQSLVDGIKAVANVPIKEVKKIIASIRNLLPFSPAKEGPLKDLDRTGPAFINTIVKGLKERKPKLQEIIADLSTNLNNITAKLATEINFVPAKGNIYPGGGGTVNNNNAIININGARMSTDEIGRAVVGALQTYGIRPQKG